MSIAPFVLTGAEWQAALGKGGLVDMVLRDGVLEVAALRLAPPWGRRGTSVWYAADGKKC